MKELPQIEVDKIEEIAYQMDVELEEERRELELQDGPNYRYF